MRLILTRHGETEDNLTATIQGQTHGKLTKLGLKQAIKLALRLKSEKIDVIYSSDLARTANTAKEIHLFHPNAPIYFTKELRERDFGSYTGGDLRTFSWDNIPADVETNEQMKERARNFFDECLQKHIDQTVLVAAHEGYNKALLSVILKKEGNYMNELGKLNNTSVSIFEIDKDKNHIIHVFNCTKHLKPDEITSLDYRTG